MTNEQLLEEAKKAIRALWEDTSVPLETALDNLHVIKAEVVDLIEVTRNDLTR